MTETAGLRAHRLDWDSGHFGFEVFEIVDPEVGDAPLGAALQRCREDGGTLVYWSASVERQAAPDLLSEFGGALVDRKTTWSRQLFDELAPGPPGCNFVTRPRGPASGALVELACVAGAFSRFRIDPRMPLGSFDRLYRTWIDRCCQGELADAVIEARSAAGEVVGMVTVALVDDTGRIGLIAVSERARGQGLGAALVQQAHINLRSRGAVRAEVVTQGTNTTACRLYGACGYAVSAIANVYHFWLR